MKIHIDSHALKRAYERGTDGKEMREVIIEGTPVKAKHGRLAKWKIYPFKRLRNGKFYEQKRVEVIYVERKDEVITITVYVFYGKWEVGV